MIYIYIYIDPPRLLLSIYTPVLREILLISIDDNVITSRYIIVTVYVYIYTYINLYVYNIYKTIRCCISELYLHEHKHRQTESFTQTRVDEIFYLTIAHDDDRCCPFRFHRNDAHALCMSSRFIVLYLRSRTIFHFSCCTRVRTARSIGDAGRI